MYPPYRKLWSGSKEERKTAAHTYRCECGQREEDNMIDTIDTIDTYRVEYVREGLHGE